MFEIVVFDGDISMLETMRLSVSISPRNLCSSLESLKKTMVRANTYGWSDKMVQTLIKSDSALSVHTLMP